MKCTTNWRYIFVSHGKRHFHNSNKLVAKVLNLEVPQRTRDERNITFDPEL